MKRLQFLIVFLLHIAFTMFSQTYTLGEKWVNCGDDVQLQDPYYYQGETIIWSGPSKGGKANGYGVATKYRDGKLISKYEGTYKNGIREGKGSYTTADGVVKTGIFVNGQLKGKGIAKDEDGNSYEGEFINYRIHGKGTMTWGNGSSFSGYFVNETPYTGKLTSYTGDVIYIEKGELVDRIEESKTSYSPKIGQQVREYFDENWHRCKPTDAAYYRLITYSGPNTPKGVVKDYYITGEVQSVQYPVFIDYDDEGKNFIEGEQTFYHKNGNAMIRQQYFNNLLNGPMEGYYEDGSLAMTGFYIMGIPDGDFVSCYPNGDFQSIKKYVDGHLLNNKCLEFTEDGTPILIYKEDFDVNSQYWETRGQNGVVEVLNANSVSLQANPERQIGGGIVTGFLPMSENIISILTTQYNPGVGTVSLLFGFKDWDNFCALSINGQQYNFNYTKNGVQVMGKEWKQSDAIHPSVNVVSVANIGEKIILIINDQPVEELGRIYYDGSFCGVSLYNPSDEPILLEAAELTVQEVPQSEEQIVQYLPESKHGANGGWTSNGSGFFISSNGYIATNYHVVADSEALQANFTRNGQVESYPADIVITDPDNDLAIIKINDSKFTTVSKLPYGLLPRQKPTGSTVYAMGYPAIGDMGTDVKFTDGKISCKSGFRGDERYYQISAPIQPGNSGGPLFDTEGNVVGINSAYYKGNGFVAQNVNYAIKSPLLKTLIEKVPEICVLEENEQAIPASNQELSEQISLYEDFVVLILSRDKK